MSHQVVYRKYRSKDFSELLGQEHISKTLSNQIKNDSIGHAYLFYGPRGTGKTSSARIFAKIVNCLSPNEKDDILIPCEVCESCKSFTMDDIDILEMDAASNRGIDDARLLREKAYSQPLSHKYKVIILDEAHMLTREAVNSLLKIIEEPPAYIIFIFCTTEFDKIPITIASRCQRFKFSFAKEADIIKKLNIICEQEGKNISLDDIKIIAKLAKGSFRDSESLLEQFLYSSDNNLSELLSLYANTEESDKFNNLLYSNDLEGLWKLLIIIEESQTDIKRILEASLDRANSLYKESKIGFDKFLLSVNLLAKYRGGGKEEILYIASQLHSRSVTSVVSSANVIQNSKLNEYVKPVNNESKELKLDSANLIKENKSDITAKDIKLLFNTKPGIANILSKSKIEISQEIITISVSSTVSKLYLQKSNIKGIIMSSYSIIKDVRVELEGDKKQNIETSQDDLTETEKIFGTKFE